MTVYERWGLMLLALTQMSDVERQVVAQTERPFSFVPDDLVELWFDSFDDGDGFEKVAMDDAILATLIEFDFHLSDLLENLPSDSEDPENYIRNDETWGTVRQLADLTLHRVAALSVPVEVVFLHN